MTQEGQKSLFAFKKKFQDFIVEEVLPFKLKWKWDVLYVYFEKRNKTTQQILDHLKKRLGLSRKQLGIAGLKDKDALTRQWICVYKRQMGKFGPDGFLDALRDVTRPLKAEWHDKPLNLSSPIRNVFAIRLRAEDAISDKKKNEISTIITDLMENGVPNYFGDQRFGVNKRNIEIGRRILDEGHTPKKAFELTFKLQAYASFLFNQYINSRNKDGLTLIDGDVLELSDGRLWIWDETLKKVRPLSFSKKFQNSSFEQPMFYYPTELQNPISYQVDKSMITWAVRGFNTLLAPEDTAAGKWETRFMKWNNINEQRFALFKQKKLYGRRRVLWMKPKDFGIRWQKDDLLLTFELGKSMYASVLIDELFSRINR